jgi:hypothetical protein
VSDSGPVSVKAPRSKRSVRRAAAAAAAMSRESMNAVLESAAGRGMIPAWRIGVSQ